MRLEARLRKLEAFVDKVSVETLPPLNEIIAHKFGLTAEQLLALSVEEPQALTDLAS